jgi:hypothetical protein
MMNSTLDLLRQLSPQDFATFGVDHLAYVRPIQVDGAPAFSIHAADGAQLSVLPQREVAFAAIRQNDMEPMSVH